MRSHRSLFLCPLKASNISPAQLPCLSSRSHFCAVSHQALDFVGRSRICAFQHPSSDTTAFPSALSRLLFRTLSSGSHVLACLSPSPELLWPNERCEAVCQGLRSQIRSFFAITLHFEALR